MTGHVATRGQVRVLQLLAAAERAGLVPLEVRTLHTLAYFANVLAPVWELAPLDGKVLKRLGGPFYPELQSDIDRLVGLGVLTIEALDHEMDEDGFWRLRGSFRLNQEFSGRPLSAIWAFPDEAQVRDFLDELCLAASVLPDPSIPPAPLADPTFGDPLAQPGNVIDFGEWRTRNDAAQAADLFRTFMPSGIEATDGELLHLFMRELLSRTSA